MRTSRGYLFWTCYIVRESTAINFFWQKLKGRQRKEKLYSKKRRWGREASGMLWLEVVGMGKLEVGYLEAGHLMRFALGTYLAFSGWSWFGNRQSGETGSHWPSPDCSGLVPAEMWVRVSQFTCGLIIVCAHVQSLSPPFGSFSGLWEVGEFREV